MNAELQRRFKAIERQRAAIQSGALALDDVQLNWMPNVAVWSVRQIVEHLVLSDETVGRARRAKEIETEALMFRLIPRSWRFALVIRALERDRVLPLPSPAIEPRGNVPLSALLSRWDTIREEMRRALEKETLPADVWRYAHPVLGPLTAVQMLTLSQTHTAYHTRQIEALQRVTAFPCRA